MLEGRIDVWVAEIPPVAGQELTRRGRDILSRAELKSCSMFSHETDRLRALVTRVLLRESLSRYAPVLPRDWEFVAGVHGRPEIKSPAGLRLRFNLSHTRRLVACAIAADREIGIDVEDATREIEMPELANRLFSPGELAAFHALAPSARGRRFFEIWVLKEAYLKARGLGFALAPRNAGFDLGERGYIRAHFTPEAKDHPAGWWFALFDALHGHVLALAVRGDERPACVRAYLATPGRESALPLELGACAESRPASLAGAFSRPRAFLRAR